MPKLPDAGAHVNDQEMPLMAAQYACVVKAASRMSTRKRVVVEDPSGPGCDSSMRGVVNRCEGCHSSADIRGSLLST